MRTATRCTKRITMNRHATRACAVVAALATGLLAGPAFGADWPNLLATGGDQAYVTNVGANAYGVHIFTNTAVTNPFTPTFPPLNVSYLIVGGGGGGGWGQPNVIGGGGGGAGGLLTNSPSSLLAISSATNIFVGAGGPGSTSVWGGLGTKGGNSSIGSLVAYGGGGGNDTAAANVGSGGGGYYTTTSGGNGTAGQGKNGGGGYNWDGSAATSGGGGGAANNGLAGAQAKGGDGGAGVQSDITGTLLGYAGGGGGGGGTSGTGSTGGSTPVGGNGANSSGVGGAGQNGRGGGGGGGANAGNGGNGGSGIVVIRYELPRIAGVPDIENLQVANVTTTSATFNGHLITNGDSSATVCVLWGETNGGNSWTSWANTNWWNPGEWANGESKGVTISSLTPNKTYYYTFAATNTTGSYIAAWPASSPQVFITGDVTVKMIIATAQYPSTQGQFQIMRPNTGTCTNLPLTIYYTMSGSAINGTDYLNTNNGSALPGFVTLAAGVTSATITVTALADLDGSETAVLTLSPSNYPCGSPAYSGTVTINPAPALAPRLLAWGGDVSYATNLNGKLYGMHKYTNTVVSDFTPSRTLKVEYLVGGGGGGGGKTQGSAGGGGGGAGGLLTNATSSLLQLAPGTTWVAVGGGGTGSTTANVKGDKGGDSFLGGLMAYGGGGGLGWNTNPFDSPAGSGGGGDYGSATGGTGTPGQGKDGGRGYDPGSGGTFWNGGGGGGAASNGVAAPSGGGGNGGDGVQSGITGTNLWYAGGGGGGCTSGSGRTGGAGGSGVGGSGDAAGKDGTDLRGGGGGGGYSGGNGGRGGRGIVVIRYEILPSGTVVLLR